MAKQFYFDTGVWNNIIGFVDIKPFKKDTFINGTYSAEAYGYGFVEVIKVTGRTKKFIVLEKESDTFPYKIKSMRKKIFIEDGVEYIIVDDVEITAHDNERYKFATKKEWTQFRKGCHSGPPSEDESDSSVSTRPSSDEEDEID